MPKTRTNRAFQIAYWSQVQSITWAASLTRYLHSWALIVLSVLIPSAETVLQFLAALHRCNRYGYIGCAVAYELLAPQIAIATRRKCSVRTLERGIAALSILGLIRRHWWTMSNQRLRFGSHDVVVRGTRRVETQDGWKSMQIRILTLTPRALALWDPSTCSKGSEFIPHFLQFLTPAKLADSPQIDQCVNTHMIQSESFDDVKEDMMCDLVSNNEQNSSPNSTGSLPSVSEGTTTRDGNSPDCRPVEHRDDQPPIAANELRQSEKLSDENPEITVSKEFPDAEAEKSPKSKPRGVSSNPPVLPKNAKTKTTWSVARSYLLHSLHAALKDFSRREADSIYSRARYELSGNYPAGWPTSVDWPYWVGRFAAFAPSQRRYHMARDILPLLRTRTPIVPEENRRFPGSKHRIDVPSKIEAIMDPMDPFLSKLWKRFCSD